MQASYKSSCVGCGDRIDIGDEIFWVPDGGARCEDCGPHTSEPRGAATGLEDAPGYVRVLEQRIAKLESANAELSAKIDKQYEDRCALQVWAVALAADLGVAPPEEVDDRG